MRRYLLRLSYIGTNYRGSQKHVTSTIVDVDSIQGAIESSIHKLNYVNTPTIVLAGRTDAGVHAMCTTAHIDLEHKLDDRAFDTSNMVKMMNRYLIRTGHDIRIFSAHEVSKDFHARYSAKTRTYLYRFLTPKDPLDHKIPIFESNRTFHFHSPAGEFDIERMRNGLKLFQGKKDFTTFSARSFNKNRTPEQEQKRRFVRTMHGTLERAQPLMSLDPHSQNFDYWQLIFSSRAFLYNQIRRMVGALLALASHKLSEEDIITMLQVPSHDNWHPCVAPAPPHGLYLMNVEYDKALTKEICS